MHSKIKRIIASMVLVSLIAPSARTLAAVDTTAPTIGQVNAKTSYSANEKVVISAPVTDDTAVNSVKLYYKLAPELPYRTADMIKDGSSNTYTAVLDHDAAWSRVISWHIEASDGTNTAKTADLNAEVQQDVDTDNQPPLIMTEVMAYTKYKMSNGGADGMDFVELYNNSSKPVNFGYYKLFYLYPGTTTAPKTWTPSKPDIIVQPGKSVIFWINDEANGLSVEDFNKYYGTNLKENEEIVKVNYSGLHETAYRKLVIGHSIDKPIAQVDFNTDNKAETTPEPETTVNYRYPKNGQTDELKVSTKELAPTPGKVYDWQIPSAPTSHTGYDDIVDSTPPEIKSVSSNVSSINEGKELKLAFDGSDDVGLVDFSLYYKISGETSFTRIPLSGKASDGHYYATIPSDKLVSKDYVEYYVEASDLYHEVKTETYKVNINRLDSNGDLRLNVTDGQVLSGNSLITSGTNLITNESTISIDGKAVDTTKDLESGAYFSLSYSGVDGYYKDAVTIEDEILSLIVKGDAPSRTVYLDKNRFKRNADGTAGITVTVRAGTDGSPFEVGTAANNDDFKATGFNLVLTDGTVIYPDNGIDSSKEYNIGDGKGMKEYLDIHFTIPKDKLTASSYNWDTKTVNDGEHTIKVVSGEISKEAKIKVDNTAPLIKSRVAEGAKLFGNITIDPSVTDANGVDTSKTQAEVDGIAVELPYKTTSSALTPGNHELKITAFDAIGNKAESVTRFSTIDENSVVSVNNSNNGQLSAKVTDPSGAKTDLTFKEAYHFNAADNEIKAYEGKGDYPLAESSKITGAALKAMSADDERTHDTQSKELPYQRFDIKVGKVKSTDRIEAVWKGRVNDNRQARMYVLNIDTNKWELIGASVKGGQSQLKASFVADKHLKDGKAQILVQDRLEGLAPQTSVTAPKGVSSDSWNPETWDPSTRPGQYDFTFAWISDTQYYSESYPQHFNNMNKWIVDHKDELNTKYLIHTGDIVDEWDKPYQWVNADNAMKIIDNSGLPYGVLGGNHDTGHGRADYENYGKNFGEKRFFGGDYYGGSYMNNKGHYDLISQGGNDFIVLYMSWDIYTPEIQWMNQVLAKYPNRKAILAFHRYINDKGAIDYTGDLVQREVVAKNPNVFAVLDGHYHGAAIKIDHFDDNGDGTAERPVYQICTDYQSAHEGGDEYIKYLYFDMKNNKIYMNSYSPFLNDYNYFDDRGTYENGTQDHDAYELNVNLTPDEKKLSTDSFDVNVYTDKVIGTASVDSGQTCSVNWENLKEGKEYAWYVESNSSSGKITGGVNEFTMKAALSSVSLKSNKTNLDIAKTAKLTVKGKLSNDENAKLSKASIKYVSSNPAVASVNDKALVTAKKAGSADITAEVTLEGVTVKSNKITITVDEGKK